MDLILDFHKETEKRDHYGEIASVRINGIEDYFNDVVSP